ADYVTSEMSGQSLTPVDVSLTVDGMPARPNRTDNLFGPGSVNGTPVGENSLIVYYTAGYALESLSDATALTIGLDADLQPGVYPIEVTVYQRRVREGEEPIVLDDAGTHQKTTVNLYVADENGDVPGVGDDEETTVTINKGTQENG